MKSILYSVTWFVFTIVSCQYDSPCPSLFTYNTESDGLYGKIYVPVDLNANTITIQLQFSFAASVDKIGPIQHLGVSKTDYAQISQYRVKLPYLRSAPRLTAIFANNNQICQGPPYVISRSVPIVSTVTAYHNYAKGGGGYQYQGSVPIRPSILASDKNVVRPNYFGTGGTEFVTTYETDDNKLSDKDIIDKLLALAPNQTPIKDSPPVFVNSGDGIVQEFGFDRGSPNQWSAQPNQFIPTSQPSFINYGSPHPNRYDSQPEITGQWLPQPNQYDNTKRPDVFNQSSSPNNQYDNTRPSNFLNQLTPTLNQINETIRPELDQGLLPPNQYDSHNQPGSATQWSPPLNQYDDTRWHEPPSYEEYTTRRTTTPTRRRPVTTPPPRVWQDTTTRRPVQTPPPQIQSFTPAPPSFQSNSIECGTVAEAGVSLIYNGYTYERGEWPWLVAMYRKKSGGRLFFSCSGSLVSSLHVISAAHCMKRKQELVATTDVIVRVGVYNLEAWEDNYTVTRKLIFADFYKDYNEQKGLKHDILVLTLNEKVIFNDYVRPVCLWLGDTNLNRIVGTTGVVTGWGKSEFGDAGQGEPRAVRLSITSTETCRASKQDFHGLTSDYTICAGDRNGSGPCVGDSGAGLYIFENNRWQIRGVVSLSLRPQSGDNTCNLDEYVVFTDASKYLPWIRTVIEKLT